MNEKQGDIAQCKACRRYSPVGRRGGFCDRLSVPVSGDWSACTLAEYPFRSLTPLEPGELEISVIQGGKKTPFRILQPLTARVDSTTVAS